jgi:hypothetical protein
LAAGVETGIMKKTYLVFILTILNYGFIVSQTPVTAGKEKDVPQKITPPQVVLDKFTKTYPDITPGWKMDGKNFVASFVDPNTLKNVNIVYDKDGNVIRKETELENSSYPQSINDYYIKKYPGEKYKTWSSVDNTGTPTYYIKRATETIWFDKNGNFVKR